MRRAGWWPACSRVLAEFELELGRERRAAAREARRHGASRLGGHKALDETKAGLAQRKQASGGSATTIAATLGVSRATGLPRARRGHQRGTLIAADDSECRRSHVPKHQIAKAPSNETVAWSWEPQRDGTLRGTDTMTVLTNECGTQRNVYRQTPAFDHQRTGDVPPAVVLADPALFLSPPAPATNGPHP